jgi:pSer/pThr/pTyr-binding forkhead associated (FHA) protein
LSSDFPSSFPLLSSPLLLSSPSTIYENHSNRQFTLSANEFSIGRGPKCSLVINVNIISHVHCRLLREPGDTAKDDIVFLEDLSTNGTFVNNDKLGKGNKCLVSNGMEVMICPKKVGVQDKIAFIYQHLYEEEVEAEEGGPQKRYEMRDTLGS